MSDAERLIAKGIEMAEEAHRNYKHARKIGALGDMNNAHEQFMAAVIGTLREIQTAAGPERLAELAKRSPMR